MQGALSLKASKVQLETVQKWQQFTAQDAEAQQTRLKETIAKAAQSPLYKKLWSQAHFKPEDCKSTADLNKIPYLTRKNLFETTRTKINDTVVGAIGHWFLGHERFDVHEYFPYSSEDFLSIASALTRLCYNTGLHPGDIVLAVVDTPPRISSFIPFLWTYSEESRNCGLEFINGSMEWYDSLGMSWITFIQKRRPTAILATKKNAIALSDKLHTIGTSVKEVLPDLRLALFMGEDSVDQLKPYSAAEAFEVYSPIEHMTFWSECKNHNGIHAWLDNAIPEVLSEGAKEAQLLSKTAAGTEGELVITNFLSSLPLVRYRSGKRIRVEGVGQCSCGANHPRIRFL
jgi:phenylacetate-CoA ligase